MSTRERKQTPASEPRKPSWRLRAKAPKTNGEDTSSQETLPAARGILAYGGSDARRAGTKPPRRVKRGAVETPPVQSVERALSLLEAVAVSAEPVPLAQLTQVLGIDPSSVFRLANTLKRRGFLANPNGRKHYVLGPAVWRLSREYDWSRMLISICRESVKALATRTGETAHLAVREGRQVFFVDHHACGDQGVIVAGQTGKLMPLHCTAHGKALLADLDVAELKDLFGGAPLHAYTRNTITSLTKLARTCERVRTDGFALDDGEYLAEVTCVAAPIRGPEGDIVASVGISSPVARLRSKGIARTAAEVVAAARAINAALAG